MIRSQIDAFEAERKESDRSARSYFRGQVEVSVIWPLGGKVVRASRRSVALRRGLKRHLGRCVLRVAGGGRPSGSGFAVYHLQKRYLSPPSPNAAPLYQTGCSYQQRHHDERRRQYQRPDLDPAHIIGPTEAPGFIKLFYAR